ncbi:MAG: hypothetical protein MJ247_05580 [Alphaproteobacteria bacterium]|nr:hypothetical protein [Alphaproteobacteria bacterium]
MAENGQNEDVMHVYNAWTEMQKDQERGRNRNGKIKDVHMTTDENGQTVVEVVTKRGGKILDSGDKKAEFVEMKREERKAVLSSKINDLIKQVIENGWVSTVDDLPPEVVEALRRACESRGIKTFGIKSEKAEQLENSKQLKTAEEKRHDAIKDLHEKEVKKEKEEAARKAAEAMALRAVKDIKNEKKRWEQTNRRTENKIDKMKNQIVQEEKKRFDEIMKEKRELHAKDHIEALRKEMFGENGVAKTIAEKEAKGEALTEKEMKMKEQAARFGIISLDPKQDTITGKKQLNLVKKDDFSKEERKEIEKEKKFHKNVLTAKLAVLDKKCQELKLHNAQGKDVVVGDIERFKNWAYDDLPEEYTNENLTEAKKTFNAQKKEFSVQRKEIWEDQKKKTDLRLKAIYKQYGVSEEKISEEQKAGKEALDKPKLNAKCSLQSRLKQQSEKRQEAFEKIKMQTLMNARRSR